MPSTAAHLLLAVDAGGTKTAAWLVDSTTVVGRGESTGGNPLSVGFAEATRAICTSADQARREAQICEGPIERAILSVAGAADDEMRNALIRWTRDSGLARRVAVVSDFLPVLAAGTRSCCGVAIISGTGSSAFARAADGRTARRGGWGYLLGDEGSGFAIGRAALRLALDALEKSWPPDGLVHDILESIGAASVSEATQTIYGSSNPRAKIASLAPLVLNAASANEPRAIQIVDAAAGELANLASSAAQAANLPPNTVQVAVSGSVLANSDRLRQRLHAMLNDAFGNCTLTVVANPLQGCVQLATAAHLGSLVTWQ